MRKLLYILIFILFSCKSTKSTKNNQLDITTTKTGSLENNIQISQIDLEEFEITFHTANEKLPVKITDEKGNTQKFENVKKATLKKKKEQKKDSASNQKKENSEKKIDKSKINEATESVSDANNFKSIFKNIALIVVCLLIVFLIRRFRIKAKTDNEINL